MANMAMPKTDISCQVAAFRRSAIARKQLSTLFLFATLATVLPDAEADTITPTLEVRGVAVDNEFDSFSESGFLTAASPGVTIESGGAKSDFLMIYAYDVIKSHDLEQDDREYHKLDLAAEFRHRPNRWSSFVRANNRLVNQDIDGVQSTNPDIIDTNSEELFTMVVGTDYSDRLTRNVQYSTNLAVDYADEEDRDRSSGAEVGLAVDNYVSDNNLTWSVQLQSSYEEDEDNDEQIDEATVRLDYRFDQTLSAFLELTATDTDFDDLNEDSALVGLRWSPTRYSFLSVGVGKRDDEDTYDLDARLTSSRSQLSASYSESVTSTRSQLFEQPNEQFSQSTRQSASITPVLRKRGDIAWTLTGLRSSVTFSIFYDEESNPDRADDEKTTGGRITLSRQVSPWSSVSISGLSQDTEFTQETTLEELSASYQKITSETTQYQLYVSTASFESTNEADEYDQVSAGGIYRISF